MNLSCVDRALANKAMVSLLLLDFLDLLLGQSLNECRPHQYVLRLIDLRHLERAVLAICLVSLDVLVHEADQDCLLGLADKAHQMLGFPLVRLVLKREVEYEDQVLPTLHILFVGPVDNLIMLKDKELVAFPLTIFIEKHIRLHQVPDIIVLHL